jgi:hypothetical protein
MLNPQIEKRIKCDASQYDSRKLKSPTKHTTLHARACTSYEALIQCFQTPAQEICTGHWKQKRYEWRLHILKTKQKQYK